MQYNARSEPRFFFIEIHTPPVVLAHDVILSEAERSRRISRYLPKRMIRDSSTALGMTKAGMLGINHAGDQA
jgi:hypothetical protein